MYKTLWEHKKTVLGEKFEYSEKLKEKKNYILYVSGMGHVRKQIEEIEEMPKPEPPKEKVVEVRENINSLVNSSLEGDKKYENKYKMLITFKELVDNIESIYENMTILRLKGSSLPIIINITVDNLKTQNKFLKNNKDNYK